MITVTNYRDILNTATPAGSTFLHGYAEQVNLKQTFPLIRAYPLNWINPDKEGEQIIEQQFFIYTKGTDNEASWDSALSVWSAFKTNVNSTTKVNILGDPKIKLYDIGRHVQDIQVIEITVKVTIWNC